MNVYVMFQGLLTTIMDSWIPRPGDRVLIKIPGCSYNGHIAYIDNIFEVNNAKFVCLILEKKRLAKIVGEYSGSIAYVCRLDEIRLA